MSRNIIKVGIIGVGRIARFAHLPAYKKNSFCTLLAIADISKSAREKAVAKFRVPHAYESAVEMLDNENLDAVSICTPPNTHRDLVVECAKRGIHVLCEKPLAISSEEAAAAVEACQRNRVILAVGFTLRFYPNIEMIKKMLIEGKFGKLYSIASFYHRPLPKSEWMFDPKVSGGGVVADLGSHVIDLHNWLVNDEVEKVSVFTDMFMDRGVEDTASILLRFKNGIFTTISLSWLAPYETVEHFVVCSTCIATMNRIMKLKYRNVSHIYRSGSSPLIRVSDKVTVFPPDKSNPYQSEIDNFMNSIIHKTKPRATGFDGLKVARLVEHIYQQIKSN